MNTLSSELLDQIQHAIGQPEGTVLLYLLAAELRPEAMPGRFLFQLAAGDHVFRLVRSSDSFLRFYHGSPGTGTRVPAVNLSQLSPFDRAFLMLAWSPARMTLFVGPESGGTKGGPLSANGEPTQVKLRAGRDGSIYQIGDVGVEVGEVSVFRDGQAVLMPTALSAWRQTKQAIDLLQQAQSPDDFIFEVVITNLTLVTLVTGLENYTKTRFLEIEREGIAPNVPALINAFTTKRERDAAIPSILTQEAVDAGVSALRYFVERGAINFQNYRHLKCAFARAYAIRFGDIGVSSGEQAWIQRSIRYRHRIVHLSPRTGLLNQPDSPPEEPVYANRETASRSITCFDAFIGKLHAATLTLRPS
jgi:hypothetical protein